MSSLDDSNRGSLLTRQTFDASSVAASNTPSSSSSSSTSKARSASTPHGPASIKPSSSKAARVLGTTTESAEDEGDGDEEGGGGGGDVSSLGVDDGGGDRETLASGLELSADERRITAKVVASEIINNEFVVYKIQVQTGTNANPGLQWKVGRRFREFESLHEKLVSRFGKDRLSSMPLPKKALLRSLDPEYIRRKKSELTRYLTDLLLDSDMMVSEEMSSFLLATIPELIESNIENTRRNNSKGETLKAMEQSLQRHIAEKRSFDKRVEELNTQKEEILNALHEAESNASILNNELLMVHTAWEAKFMELVAHAKELRTEKKTALKFVRDLDEQLRRLKVEKKMLIKEVKDNRAQLAAIGALGDKANLVATGSDGHNGNPIAASSSSSDAAPATLAPPFDRSPSGSLCSSTLGIDGGAFLSHHGGQGSPDRTGYSTPVANSQPLLISHSPTTSSHNGAGGASPVMSHVEGVYPLSSGLELGPLRSGDSSPPNEHEMLDEVIKPLDFKIQVEAARKRSESVGMRASASFTSSTSSSSDAIASDNVHQ